MSFFLVVTNIATDLWKWGIRGHSKSKFVEVREEGGHWKANKNEQGEGVLAFLYVCFFQKKMLTFSKWSFIVILQFLLFIIMAVWNIKQPIMKDYNI